MKRTITLCTLIVFASLGTAGTASANSKLYLDLFEDGIFTVQIDGIRYQNVTSGIDVNGLFPGTHKIRIVEVFRGRRHRNNSRSTLYNGTINIPFRSEVFARLTPNLRLRITEVRRIQPPRRNRNQRYRNSGNRGYNKDHRRNNRRYREFEPMFDAFSAAKLDMHNATWDKDKLKIAKAFAIDGLTSSELASLMGLLTFERSKIELAKFGHGFVLDKQNFNLVHQAFTYDNSINDLNRFIRRKH
jgi:Domain of unknown function (DUF4476)